MGGSSLVSAVVAGLTYAALSRREKERRAAGVEGTQRRGLDALEQGVTRVHRGGEVEQLNRAGIESLRHRPDDLTTLSVAASVDLTEVRRQEVGEAEAAARLVQAEAELRRSFEQSAMATVWVDGGGRFTRVNAAFATLVGIGPGELLGSHHAGLLHPDDRAASRGRLSRLGRDGTDSAVAEVRLVRPDGTTVWTRTTTTVVRAADGATSHYVAQVEDVTAIHQAQEAVRISQARFAALVERSTDIICVFDAAGTITYASPAIEGILGYAAGWVGTAFAALVHHDDQELVATAFAELAVQPAAVRPVELRLAHAGGDYRFVEVVATNRLDDPAVGGIVANIRDVTERAEAASRLEWQAFHDPLTQLPNRALLLDRVGRAVERARRSGELTALLFVDLDRFKLVNDTMGHEAGDRLLVEVAQRLRSAVRTDDTVARLGGDEFVVLTEGLGGPAEAEALARRIIAVLGEPVGLPHGPVTVSGSIGIAYDTDHRPETLLREADTALYRAKERGRDRFETFDASLRVEAVRRMATEQLLRRALDDGGLEVHYQPIIDLVTGQAVSAEALLRIPGPDGRLRSPDEFISVAEDSGLIVPVGAGVLDAACRQLARWRTELGDRAPRRVAVNVSARQLDSSRFPDLLDRTVRAHGLEHGDLTVEVTESTVLDAGRSSTRTVERLHSLGVGLAIDDFGTGYSSLAYLRRLPIDTVKLDRSFVDGYGTDPSATEIVKAVVSLGRSLGLTVVAEGIETPEQLSGLVDLGCDCGQGYLLAVPAPGGAWAEALARHRRLGSLTRFGAAGSDVTGWLHPSGR